MRVIRVLLVLFSVVAFISAANITVQHMSGNSSMTGNSSMAPYIKLTNNDAANFAMDNYQVEYYFYDPTLVASNLSAPIDWCKINGASDVTSQTSASLSDLNPISDSQTKKANIVVVYAFNAGAVLQQNEFMEIHARIHKTTWQYTFDENDDWSFADLNTFTTANNIVVREKSTGTIIWGTEPVSYDPYVSPTMTPATGATFASNEQTFSWTSVSDVTGYELWLESAAGLGDIAHFGGDGTMALTTNFSDLPIDGSTVLARLKVYHASGAQTENYSYTAYTNHAPTDIEIFTQAVYENSPIGTHIVLLNSVIDADANDVHTFTMNPSTGDNGLFTLTGDKLYTAQVFDFESKNQFNLTVTVTDNYGAAFDKVFTIGILDVEPEYQYPEVTGEGEDMKVEGVSLFSNIDAPEKDETMINGGEVTAKSINTSGDINADGVVTASQVKIGDWTLRTPDYVFQDDYKLRSLEDVEKHINEKSHLPEVPSAADMKRDGVELSSMSMILLRKIEELTIYTIEQQKRIAALEEKVK